MFAGGDSLYTDVLMDIAKIIYLECTCNNRADTVLQMFIKGVQENEM